MVFNTEALAGKSKQAQMVKAFKVTEVGTPGKSTWTPT